MGSARCRRGRRRRVVASGSGHPSRRRSRLRDVPRCVRELFHSDPIDLGYVLGRTPLSPLVVGVLLDLVPRSARRAPHVAPLCGLGDRVVPRSAQLRGAAALLTVGIVLLYPGYGIVMHELSSDSVFADRVRRLVVARRAGAPVTDAARLRARRVGRRSPRARAAGQSGAARAGGDPTALSAPVADTARVVGGLRPRRCRAPRCAGPSTTASATATTRSRAVGTRACRSSGPS